MAHRLDPLLRPASIAVVGASARAATVGHQTFLNLKRGGFPGQVFAVNPKYEELEGIPCTASIGTLAGQVEHAVFALSDERIEDALDEAIAAGVRAVTIMSSLILDTDTKPALRTRVEKRLRDNDILCCGGNGMGFYNFHDRVWVCGFATRDHRPPGNVALISQSGSGMCGIVDVDARIDFNLAVSAGQELTVSLADYLDFALDLPETKAVGLFMETLRDVPAAHAAFAKARAKAIPIVAVKVGRTELSARMALSHTGAIAGDDDAYQALFDRYAIARADDLDELATALILFAQPHPVGPGGLVSIHDSGGVRQLVVDVADAHNVPLAELDAHTTAELERTLDVGLLPLNPLDTWSKGGPDFKDKAAGYLTTLMKDPNAALGAVIQDRNADSAICTDYVEYLRAAHAATGKPAMLVSSRQGTGSDPQVVAVTREGFPVLDGVAPFLKGVKHLLAYRDARGRTEPEPAAADDEQVQLWRQKLAGADMLDETEAMQLIAAFGVPVVASHVAESGDEAVAHAESVGYPVVMKTLAPGIAHKTEAGGVKLHLECADQVRQAHADLAARLGPRVLVAPMVTTPGVELVLGCVRDPQFGPLVMIGFGGIYAEVLKDSVFCLPPFGPETVLRRIADLRLRPLLDAQRGRPALDLAAFARAASRFSVLASSLGDAIAEIDVNPIHVMPDGCVALDALVVPVRQHSRKVER